MAAPPNSRRTREDSREDPAVEASMNPRIVETIVILPGTAPVFVPGAAF